MFFLVNSRALFRDSQIGETRWREHVFYAETTNTRIARQCVREIARLKDDEQQIVRSITLRKRSVLRRVAQFHARSLAAEQISSPLRLLLYVLSQTNF